MRTVAFPSIRVDVRAVSEAIAIVVIAAVVDEGRGRRCPRESGAGRLPARPFRFRGCGR